MADYALNKTNLINRKDYGIRVARPGYNALSCADNQLLFNSSWPIIQIVTVLPEILLETTGSVSASAILLSENETIYKHCACTDKLVYTREIVTTYFDNDSIVNVTKKYGCNHTLGFPPLAFPSSQLSNTSGYVVITNIDVSTDVDYPYTSAPLAFVGGSTDYGIKSRAYYAPSMPRTGTEEGYGINTNISSKMIQAVKTLETAVPYTDSQSQTVKYVTWEPPRDEDNKFIFGVTDFEYFAYGSNNNVYEPVDAAMRPVTTTTSTAQYVVATLEQGGAGSGFTGVSSLVVVRSPMVAPEIVEVNYGP